MVLTNLEFVATMLKQRRFNRQAEIVDEAIAYIKDLEIQVEELESQLENCITNRSEKTEPSKELKDLTESTETVTYDPDSCDEDS